MKSDKYGQPIFTENDLVEIFYKDPEKRLHNVKVDKPIPNSLGLENFPTTEVYQSLDISIEEFDTIQQGKYFIPDEYKNIDIAQYILDLCTNDAELQRAGQELLLFQERNMFDLLRYLKYLVDTMRENNIVWGVGRGSSVSSFVLFLLGVHHINSLYYDLSIDEFLK